jgi:CRISPR type III-B/RAMP module-associated protein Cmr5
MRTRAQTWSSAAFQHVRAQKADKSTVDKYRTCCRRMPGLIHTSGLLQALVFTVSRDDTGKAYVGHLARAYLGDEKATHETLITRAQSADVHAYMALARDIADVAQWFNRFARIELGGGDDGR